jgi:endonuclease/exonuclease/phosphatase family metal-dependent hydrolase
MPTLTVASFNAHHGVDRHFRPYDVVAACERLDADILAIQEVWRPRGEPGFAVEVADQLGYKVHEIATAGARRDHHMLKTNRDPGAGVATWGMAVLTRFSSQPRPPIELGLVPGDRARRVAQPVDVEVEGEALVVLNVHATHRLYASFVHLRRLRAIAPPLDRPAVLLGDMNMWGPVLLRSLPDGWRRAVLGRTWPAHRPHSQIDHIVVTPPVTVLGGEVLPPVGSDHRAVRATISF